MRFYWERLLPKVTGNAGWSERVRRNTIPSMALCPWDHTLPLLHHSAEPFLCVLYHNHYRRWVYQLQWMQDNGVKKIPKRNEGNKDEKIHSHSEYTEQDGGQKRIGGWNQAGVRKFNTLYRVYVQAKHNVGPDALAQANQNNIKGEWIAKEQAFLVKLQAHHKVPANSTQQGPQGGGPVAVPVVMEEALGFDF